MKHSTLTRIISKPFGALRGSAAACALLGASLAVLGGRNLAAQDPPDLGAFVPAPASKNAPAATVRPVSHHKSSPAKAAVPDPAPDPTPAPPAPEPPKWPVNDAPAPASVKWDSHGLQVDAPNSSLRQILDEVATTTGAKVEGLGPDERVFGEYGPGPARDVLSQILHGSSYNVMMLGDQGEGTPREIILSQRTTGGSQPNQTNIRPNPQDDDADQPQPPEPDEPNRQTIVPPPMNQPMNQPQVNQPGGPMTPQQRMLEMQRQQMLMQQQQQQNVPPPQPPPQPPQE